MKKIILSITLIAVSITSFGQVGIETTSPDASSVLDISSTAKGFLPPRMSEVEMNTIASPAEGLMVYCLDCSPKGLYFNDGNNFVSASGFVPSGLVEGDVYSSTTGRIWMDRNLGATQVATSSTDAASYGDLYQWGRAKDGHESRTSAKTAITATSADPGHGDFIKIGAGTVTDNNWTDFAEEDDLWQLGLNDPCPTGYRIPTEVELNNERLNFSSNDAAGAFASVLKLPNAGRRHRSNGSLSLVDTDGRYWSSTINGTSSRALLFHSSDAFITTNPRGFGFSVRCIKEE